MNYRTTERGFSIYEFKDRYNIPCSLQKSSIATEDCIWLGVDDADPKIMASQIIEGGTGWAKYPIPDSVSLNTRMHLSVEQVKELIPILQKFVESL
jgi:hypothetical protein